MTLTQWLAIWAISAVVASPFIGEWLHKRRKGAGAEARSQGQSARATHASTPVSLPRDPMKYEGRDLTPEQKRAIAVSDSRWTADVRKAESLGFIEPERDWDGPFSLDEPEQPKRSA